MKDIYHNMVDTTLGSKNNIVANTVNVLNRDSLMGCDLMVFAPAFIGCALIIS